MSDIARSHLWYTSRSAHERGTSHCPFARYVEYHAGPYGYGFSRRAHSLPLVTGTYSHLGLTNLLGWVKDAREHTGTQPDSVPDDVVRWAVETAVEKYRKTVEARGILTYAQEDAEQILKFKTLIREQEFLIEGLTWAWSISRLPIYLRDYIILDVEQEEEYVLECSCGLGNGIGSFEDHELRGCTGIGLQSKPDILSERKSDGEIAYTEFKTSSVANKGLDESWERKQQFILGMLGAERRLGKRVSHAWVETLVKGKRDKEYPYGPDQPKIQRSPFCYAYYAPPKPPLSEAEWRPAYTYYTALGEKFTADKKSGYKNTPIWEIDPAEGWPGKPAEMSVIEYWAKVIQQDYPQHMERQVHPVGPIPRNDVQVEKALRSVVAEERLWQDRLWKIYEFAEKTGKQWGDDEFFEFVETVVPRSWKCDPFASHPCGNQPICHPVTDDYRQPVESNLFVYRTPHHMAELEQMKARGLMPPASELAMEDDEQEERDE